jgi:hypothetical protein
MEHPLIGPLGDLTEEQLLEKINELNKKLSFVARTGNGMLCNQIRMAIESYQNQYRECMAKNRRNNGVNFDDKIDIQ